MTRVFLYGEDLGEGEKNEHSTKKGEPPNGGQKGKTRVKMLSFEGQGNTKTCKRYVSGHLQIKRKKKTGGNCASCTPVHGAERKASGRSQKNKSEKDRTRRGNKSEDRQGGTQKKRTNRPPDAKGTETKNRTPHPKYQTKGACCI